MTIHAIYDRGRRNRAFEVDLYVNVNYLTVTGGAVSAGSKSAQDRPRKPPEENRS